MLLRRLAVGGMAEVYVAKAKGIGGFEKLVAIKVIHPRFSEDEHFVQMLVEEAKITVQLSHVNIAQTFDLGCIDDTYFISMEFIEGADAYRVEKRARDRKLAIPIDIACYIASEILNGLGYAHRKRDAEGKPLGIVHRDISPQNVLISYSGEVKLVDFGIAKAALRGGQTEVGVIKGKYYYMSPEQAWGDPVDGRTDVFSAGLLLHELLTGEMVYQEDNVPALLDRVRKAEVPSPRKKRADVPEELAQIVLKATSKEADDRFESAHAMAQELTRFLYTRQPTFTASRLAQLMGTLFPEEVKRHSQVLKLPTAEEEAARAVAKAAPSVEEALPPMSREEFAPSAEQSVIFDLDEVQEMTRNDILPFRRKDAPAANADRPTKQLSVPRGTEEPTTTAKVVGSPDDWEEETLLKDEEDWDESTLVDEDGQAMQEIHRLFGGARRSEDDDEETDDMTAEKTVAMASFPGPAIAPPARSPKKPPSMPPPARLPARPPPPRRAPEGAELPGEATQALSPDQLPTPGRVAGGPPPAPPFDGDGPPADLPAEKTVAIGQEPPPPSPRGGGIAVAPSAGVRLGPEADRFFAHPSNPELTSPAPAGPFDPLGGTPPPSGSAPPTPGQDPFVARPPERFGGGAEELGKPTLRRLMIPAAIGVAVVFALIAGGAWLAARPKPTSLEVMTVPDRAQVTVDGRTLVESTPVTLEDLAAGQTLRLEIRHPGFEPTAEELTLAEGLNRKVYLLNAIRATLHVETDPSGAQVWVDNVLRGSAPLDIAGLAAGQTLTVRSTAPGRETVSRSITIDENERTPSVTLALPPAPP